MRKFTVKITEATDVVAALGKLRSDYLSCATSQDDPEILFAQIESIVNKFVEQGKKLSAIGSQFEASQTLQDRNCKVVLNASFGARRPSLIARLCSLFTRR